MHGRPIPGNEKPVPFVVVLCRCGASSSHMYAAIGTLTSAAMPPVLGCGGLTYTLSDLCGMCSILMVTRPSARLRLRRDTICCCFQVRRLCLRYRPCFHVLAQRCVPPCGSDALSWCHIICALLLSTDLQNVTIHTIRNGVIFSWFG